MAPSREGETLVLRGRNVVARLRASHSTQAGKRLSDLCTLQAGQATIGRGPGFKIALMSRSAARRTPESARVLETYWMRGVNYFRRLATTISAGMGRQGVSPTTWRHSVIVVGRLVAVESVSAGAPIGA
jgi:hypothetical protein